MPPRGFAGVARLLLQRIASRGESRAPTTTMLGPGGPGCGETTADSPEAQTFRHSKEKHMNLVHWDPTRELEDICARLNRIFGRSPLPAANGEAGKDALMVFDWSPTVDISETPEEFQIKAELPEVKKEDVKVSVDNGVLRLEGERKHEKEDKTRKYHRIERSYGSFLRTFTLPDNVDDTKVRAEFKDGVLNVRLPKTEKAKPKAIEVAVG
jgi:HSP20 family protein